MCFQTLRLMNTKTRLLILAVLVIAVGATLWLSPKITRHWWRIELLATKMRGELPEVSLPEVIRLAHPGSGFWLPNLIERPNPNSDILNPFVTQSDLARGAEIFRENCAACHGVDARGTGTGPPLADHTLSRAYSDWSTYKVITAGIPGTSMPARELPWTDTWRLVGFVRSLAGYGTHEAQEKAPAPGVDYDLLAEAASHSEDWLMYAGSYDGRRHSRLAQINSANVEQLQITWLHHIDTEFMRNETVPLVRNGIMYFSAPPAKVFAVDAASGKRLWSYQRPVPAGVLPCCGYVNRGVALLGNRLFFGTLDAHLIALDATSGTLVWDAVVADYRDGYTITSPPLTLKKLIVTGISGGDFATRGFIAAYDADDGTQKWRFETIPGEGEKGNDTWAGDSWRTGGASTWITGSYDTHSNLLLWGVGNPAPDFIGDARLGDNLYSNSVVALNPDSGKLSWYFQFTPHDLHDWDSAQTPIVVDDARDQSRRRKIAWANRNGFFYLLDAADGQFILAKPFAKQTWAKGIDAQGRPLTLPGTEPSRQGTLVYPSVEGATNWWAAAFNSDTRLLYVPVLERPSIYYRSEVAKEMERTLFLGSAVQGVASQPYFTAIRALDSSSGSLVWEKRWPDRPEEERAEAGGLLTTSGGLVFGSELTTAFALDAKTGKTLWSFDMGARIAAAPITYMAEGRQYVSFIAGRTLLALSLPKQQAAKK